MSDVIESVFEKAMDACGYPMDDRFISTYRLVISEYMKALPIPTWGEYNRENVNSFVKCQEKLATILRAIDFTLSREWDDPQDMSEEYSLEFAARLIFTGQTNATNGLKEEILAAQKGKSHE